jgi:uncharacterized protein (TIGR02466 family)
MRNVIELFPIPIQVSKPEVDLSSIKAHIDKLNTKIDTIKHEGYSHPFNDQLFSNKVFESVKVALKKEVDVFMREVLLYKYDDSFFSCSWFNVNEPKSSHHRHYHPNSIVSGVLFVEVPEKSGQLIFITPHNRDIVVERKKNADQNSFSCTSFAPRQESGTLILFPSFVEHLVTQNNSNKNRYSISFNVFVKGHLGHSGELTYCRLQ